MPAIDNTRGAPSGRKALLDVELAVEVELTVWLDGGANEMVRGRPHFCGTHLLVCQSSGSSFKYQWLLV